jgi:hypothetical protein
MSAKVGKSPRSMLALDMLPAWKEAARKFALPHYPDSPTMTDLLRSVLEEFILAHMTEKQMRDEGLLPDYRTKHSPDHLLFAIQRARKIQESES